MCLRRHQVAPQRGRGKRGCEIWITRMQEKKGGMGIFFKAGKREREEQTPCKMSPGPLMAFGLHGIEIALHHLHTLLFYSSICWIFHQLQYSPLEVSVRPPCPWFFCSLVSVSLFSLSRVTKTHQSFAELLCPLRMQSFFFHSLFLDLYQMLIIDVWFAVSLG